MLKKWIDEIRNKPDLYKTECWKYHLSGNAIEVSILPEYLQEKRLYRCSVIAVGQVLQALSERIEEKHLNYHIQSFPNLENPEIVATLRTGHKENSTNHFESAEGIFNSGEEIVTTLQNLTDKYQFYIKEVEDPTQLKLVNNVTYEAFASWYVVYSVHNNPFTWLNLGYLEETLRNQELYFDLGLYNLCSDSKTTYQYLQVSKNEYMQSIIGVQPVNVST